MGGLCCYKISYQTIDSDSTSISPVFRLPSLFRFCAKTEAPFGHLVSMSYTQQRKNQLKERNLTDSKRLLVFLNDRIFIDSLLGNDCIFKNEYILDHEAGSIIYGSFAHGNKSKYFLTLNKLENRYFIRTYEFTESEQDQDAIKRIRQLNPLLFDIWYTRLKTKGRTTQDGNDAINAWANDSYTINQCEEKELKEFKDQSLSCVKTIKSITSGQAELMVVSNVMIGTIIISKASILLTKTQAMPYIIIGIEYWSGYYFLLYNNNSMGIYKRTLNLELQKVRAFKFNLTRGVTISGMKVPKLEWSGRFPDILHKEIPAYLLLIGTYTERSKTSSYIFNYNINKNQCDSEIMVSPELEITAINYGPYDNGPIIIGLNDGTIIAYDYYSLQLIRKIKGMVESSVKWIAYEVGNMIIIGTRNAVYKCRSI